ncbi:MAG: hypothetical protein WCP12_16990 [bacterium]
MKRVTWQSIRTVLAVGVLAAFIAKAGTIAQVAVPTPVFTDTETVSYVALPTMDGKKYFKVSLDFNASPSNCLTVAFGRDADGDGKLSLREQSVELGWDGAWSIRRKGVAAWERYELAGTEGRHLFEASKWLYRTRPDQQLNLSADGVPLAFGNGTDAWLPLSVLDGGTVRVTSRGTGVEGTAQIIVNADGTVLQLK